MGLINWFKNAQANYEIKQAEVKKQNEEQKKELQEYRLASQARVAEYKEKLANKKLQKTSNNYQQVVINDSLKDLTVPKPHVMNIKVAGVTFENRQDILKKIYNKQKPFNQQLDIAFIGVDFNGELAIEIKINNQLIGYVERKRINEFVKHMNYGYKITKFFPGYNEESNIYYCTIKAEFAK